MIFEIKGDYIELNKLLKATGIADTGGIAGEMIKEGFILVNGEVETQKRKKLYTGMRVTFEDQEVTIA